jgi:hypothetical protein
MRGGGLPSERTGTWIGICCIHPGDYTHLGKNANLINRLDVADSGKVQAKSLLEAEVKQRCKAELGGGATSLGAPSVKEMQLLHSMGIAGMSIHISGCLSGGESCKT